ncbi:GNAT family N-acetyltransferase [Aestuariibacter sp. AA17]|uniref:GNAT family N-acetyltransferase n=1 Tax=Fluctibacter corallii TaxID=2984329 RepID=A0ABT3AAS7_9ALTE|nr:GNAT family N-acetyltransferase [Aestuariibacter sp. AA17]MCV2885397.1 GNAT family N-acetyltransferase [Aestuariibacter sp. AA17]
MKIEVVDFSALSLDMLYEILRLRMSVFIVEQQSIYEDIDGLDKDAKHILVTDGGALLGYCRLRRDQTQKVAKIERVVIAEKGRGRGLGQQIMHDAIQFCEQNWSGTPIKLSAQTYLTKFYQSFGFIIEGAPYDDGGILHIDMRKQINK